MAILELFSNLDIKLFYFLNHQRSPLLDSLLPFFSHQLFFLIFLFSFLFPLFFSFKKEKKQRLFLSFLFFLLGYGLSDFTCSKILKPIFLRERPFAKLERVYYYSPKRGFLFLEKPLAQETQSLPSCHATNASFLSSYLFFFHRKTLYLTLPTSLLIGYSRIYLGHHFPLDVLFGYGVGFLLALLIRKVKTKIEKDPLA